MNFRISDMLGAVLLATGVVLGQAAQLEGAASVVVRPLVLSALLAAVLHVMAAAITRTRPQAVLGSTAAVALLGGLALSVVVVVLAVVLVIVSYWRHIRGHAPLRASALATMATRTAVIFALVGLVGFVASQPVLNYPRPASVTATSADLPPIYLILLDGYPRQDMLREYFGIDDASFLDALTERGFDVYPDATSNHNYTALTLATMFNATPAAELTVDDASMAGQYRALHRLFNDGSVWDSLRHAGYSIATIPPTLDGVKLMTADASVDGGLMSGFEIHLIRSTSIGPLLDAFNLDLVHDQHRSRLEAGFSALPGFEESGTFTLAHFFLPHRPLVFNADGTPREEDACQDDCTNDEFHPAYAEQLAYTSDQVIQIVDRLPPDAVVVIFSDHGSREPLDPLEWLRTLLVARTPDHPRLFGDEPQPLTWLPRLLNTYAGTQLTETDGGHWRSYDLPMDMEPVDP